MFTTFSEHLHLGESSERNNFECNKFRQDKLLVKIYPDCLTVTEMESFSNREF